MVAAWIAIPGTLIVTLLVVPFMFPKLTSRFFGMFPSRKRVRIALRRESINRKLNPNWLDAIGAVEGPYWKPNAVNLTGGDAARGGAYGATQITAKTARAYGYEGPMEALLKDESLMAKWSAIILSAGQPKSYEDAIAWWNAGRKRFADLPPDHMTRTKYLPKALDSLAWVEANPPEKFA